jgi:hypothetical protein
VKAKSAQRDFVFGRFTVTVPEVVVIKWQAMPVEEIIGSVLANYRNLRGVRERAEFKPILEAIRTELELDVKHAKNLTDLEARLKDHRIKERILSLLQFAHFREWNNSPIKVLFARAVGLAAMDGDDVFFRRLGRRLEEEPIPYKPPLEPNALSAILLEHWVSQHGLCLCWFSDNALTSFLAHTTGIFTVDAVRKAHERLGLVKLRRPLLRSVRREGDKLVCA